MNIDFLKDPMLWVCLAFYIGLLFILPKLFPNRFNFSDIWREPEEKGFRLTQLALIPLFLAVAVYGILKLLFV